MRTLARSGPAAALVLLAAAGAAATQSAPAPTRTPVVRSPGNADWAVAWEEARGRAADQNKLVFVEFEGEDCGNCQRMDELLYNAMDFEALLVPMVPVKLHLESVEGKTIAARYEVQEAPSVLITTPEGRLVFLMQGFKNAPDFYTHAHQDLDTYRRFARRVDAQDVAKLPAAEALATGRELFQRQDPAAALPRLQRAARAADATPAIRDEALELAAAAELELGKPASSIQTIDKVIATTKDPDRRERAELFRAQIPLSENKPAEALRLFQAFKKAHPKSPYIAGVDAIIQKLLDAKPR
jgi:tetratricopeptide (TPR) repeat protein